MKIMLGKKPIDFRPTKIVCLAKNYMAHAAEMNSQVPKTPRIFLKPISSLICNNGAVILPAWSDRVEHEVELAVVIGKRCRNVSEKEAMSYVLGYSIMLDITARDIQAKAKDAGMPWTEAKAYDTFAPFGPRIIPAVEFDPSAAGICLKVNDKIRQEGNTREMVFKIPFIISHISHIMTLEEHDIIATGTPEGVGIIRSGDTLEAAIEGIGTLKNRVN